MNMIGFIFYKINIPIGGGVVATKLMCNDKELMPGRSMTNTGDLGNL